MLSFVRVMYHPDLLLEIKKFYSLETGSVTSKKSSDVSPMWDCLRGRNCFPKVMSLPRAACMQYLRDISLRGLASQSNSRHLKSDPSPKSLATSVEVLLKLHGR